MPIMFSQFRAQYPQGSLTSELLQIDHGRYIVRALVVVDGVTLASGLAADLALETAEDQARLRALALLNLDTALTRTESPGPLLQTEPMQSPPAPEPPPLATSPTPSAIASPPPAKVTPVPIPDPLPIEKKAEKAEKDEIPPVPSAPSIKETAPEVEALPLPAITVAPQSNSLPPKTDVIQPEVESIPIPHPAPLTESPAPLLTFIPETEVPPATSSPAPVLEEPIDFSEVIARSNVELKRLGWTSDQGRNYLLQTYGKRSRQLLSDEELLEFLQYLESQPTPN
ncbi:hypothetical protein [Synechocystis sp. LKSZ1]|uniref:hypothetical protein n=1 Tax=Synechocystis sp. LKSZ1 TaxID=3144951 RepID=UPI00336BEBD0